MPNMDRGIRKFPIIWYSTDCWWVLNIVYGFETHTSSPKSMDTYAKYKVFILEEEGEISHMCQRYDHNSSSQDKSSSREYT